MKLIVGLGNPEDKRSLRPSGLKYAGTRHNLGFEVLDALGKRVRGKGGSWEYKEKFKSEILDLTLNASRLILVKPQTYVNKSGIAVKLLSNKFGVQSEDIIIVHDELDLPLGKIKIRLGGAAAGHHGVESIINTLGTDQFIRVRLGIGNLRTKSGEHKGQTINAEKFVLEPFLHSEKSQVKHMLKQTIKALDLLLEKGLEAAQTQFN